MILAALTVAATLTAQQSIRLTSEKQGKENQVSVENVKVERTEEKILVSMDFILDSLDVPSNRYRAFTPVIRSKDGMQTQRLKTLIVSGRRQAIVFERDGIDPLYADNCDVIRFARPLSYSYSDVVERQPWHNAAVAT